MNETKEDKLINSMQADDESVNVLADYLGYQVGMNPVDPSSQIKIYFSDRLPDKSAGAMAVVPEPDLNVNTKVVDIRKLYSKVLDIRDNKLGLAMPVSVICFIGQHRLVFFPTLEGNRDTRLDLTPETVNVDFYKQNMGYLHNDRVQVQKSPFGLNARVEISKNAFKKKLSDSFLQMINFYRKKLSEWITASDLKKILSPILLSDKDKVYIADNNINLLVQDESYKTALSTVVDTIILRQLMRRFLEGYYGADSFNVDDISLGVGSGTLDDAIQQSVNFAESVENADKIKKLNQQHLPIGTMDLFQMTSDETNATTDVRIKDDQKKNLSKLSKKALKQFQLAYGGDLFAGSIGKIATKIETRIDELDPKIWSKMYVDTVLGNYSFRYQDLPPEVIEKQYEDSMSQDVQLTLNRNTGKAEAFFGDDTVEQKSKGAYYTDQCFVSYMIDKTVGVEFNKRFKKIKEAVKSKDSTKVDEAIQHLLDLKIADFTCGGGSFLRGAFLKLADQFNLIQGLDYPEETRTKYKFLQSGNDEAQYQWENYILHHMIYGVDIDYKAIIITSLTLSLSSLQHRPKHTKLPSLIGHTLINQNSLINAVPYYKRKEVFNKYKYEIAKLCKLKETDFTEFTKLKDDLQAKVIPECGYVSHYASLLGIQSLELNLPEVYFNEDGSVNEHGGMDIVVGNPPWEIWKPNSDEFFSQYDPSYRDLPNKRVKRELEKKLIAQMPEIKEKWQDEQDRIKAGSKYFRSVDNFHYQTWKVNGRKTSSDLNLYKDSVERFTQLGKKGGRFSILVPDNFATDNGSTGIRHLVIDHYDLQEFLSFVNNKGIFAGIHRSYKFACLTFNGLSKTNRNSSFKAFFYRESLDDLTNEDEKMSYPIDFLLEMEPERYAMVEARNNQLFNLFKKIRMGYPALRDTKLIKFGSDFHRTNDANLFINIKQANNSDVLLYEGKYINQFQITPSSIQYAVKRDIVKKKIKDDFNSYRLTLRTVASSTNQRSLIATLLPKNVSTMNSLMAQKNASLMKITDKLFILGFLNSYVLDFVLRQLISMNINKIYLQQLPIPRTTEIADHEEIIQISKELLKENKGHYPDLDELVPGTKYQGKKHDDLIAELNARVMIDFNLNRDEAITLMHTFESANHKREVEDETQRILDVYDQLKEEGE